ncbi:biotin transporter BioY [Parasporobacterium paucivorans]|uniref:Biotin transporter n=1 Tax=Parasporobacterium paucivorans DSM 15970 TaxID=1122934 RepID=A0A1M6G1Y7_9FIRM|nr:biotin transporter BioY [Parasporobacterium paucivorans]SHJ03877.1 biotin transport system substrate-specific component [Parasporobacterium paucivorans DSM 15970]
MNVSEKIVYVALCVALITICSWISLPFAIPFTLQTFAVFVTAGLMGVRKGVLSILVYILLGAVGVPVFAGFRAGFGVLAGNTGGYLIGFVFSVIVTAGIIRAFGRKVTVMALAMVAGLLVCYAFGTAWFMYFYAASAGTIGLFTALSWCVFPFIIPDLIKIAIAIVVVRRVSQNVRIPVR